MTPTLHSLIFGLLALGSVSATRAVVHNSIQFPPEYTLHITEEEALFACRSRLSALINGISPGPTIYMRENHTTWIRVYNHIPNQNLTMHWHGLSQSSAPFSDGTPVASQWPIKPGHFFDYEVRPQIGEAGTYFYHSHVGLQAVTAAGPVIVDEYNMHPAYSYDDEQILFITELWNKTDLLIQKGLEQSPTNFTWIGDAEALLVNGKSYNVDAVRDNNSTCHSPKATTNCSCGPEVLTVQPNTSYRIRVIGGVGLTLVSFGIEAHDKLSIISVDGKYTMPFDTDHIQLASGQRFDFILRTKSKCELRKLGKAQFWIQLEPRNRPTSATSWALLSYNVSDSTPPVIPADPPASKVISLTNDVQQWLEYALKPMELNGFPTADQVTRTVYLRVTQLRSSHLFWAINNRTWTEENEHYYHTDVSSITSDTHAPYLVNIYKHGEAAIPNYDLAVDRYAGWDPELNAYAARVGEIIDIIIVNERDNIGGGYDYHPFHIHGGHVYDLGGGPGEYNATANEERLKGYTPVLRDTTILYKYPITAQLGPRSNCTDQGWRAWRLNVTDAGVWMLHCHTLPHMVMGMQSVWIMGNATEITRGTNPDLINGYLTYGGDAYGNTTHDPLVVHYYAED